MELRHLRYFVAVADRGSFVEASKRLYVSQSAISEQIADLENELGGPLFVRRSRPLALTEQGKIFLTEARKVLNAGAQATKAFKRSLAGEVGTLSIGFFAWGIGSYFTESIREFKLANPGVNLELHEMLSHEQMEALGNGTLDVAFSRPLRAPFDHIYHSEPLYTERMMVMMPKGHRLAGAPVAVEELASEPIVLRDGNGASYRSEDILKILAEAGIDPDVVSRAKTWPGVVSLVEAGIGVALAPSGIRRIVTAGLALEPLLPEHTDVGIAMTWSAQNKSPLLASFLSMVRKSCAKDTESL
ncbi:LysR substrate-binding domain-containing protein [Granulicella cerasi]|uniref:LysR substrate-binding domain-containing protein n=1 Tax=Granulicella cerasi TaxID=741063 RepID=A0ABW1ZBE8_9BACT|nr:LysR substrate-binding domain-containing protein [Granulicella cerasi]